MHCRTLDRALLGAMRREHDCIMVPKVVGFPEEEAEQAH